jgi:hypothetical protein
MKFTQENRDLADQLHREMKNNQKPKSATTGAAGGKRLAANNRANGSDFSSARGSEERHASVAAQSGSGRGPRRNRDYDLEQVSRILFPLSYAIRFISLHRPVVMTAGVR